MNALRDAQGRFVTARLAELRESVHHMTYHNALARRDRLAGMRKAWPELPEPIRAAILAMIQSATGERR